MIDSDNLTITGPGPADLIISGNNSDRIFTITPGLQVTISGLTLQDGRAETGGAIHNDRSHLSLADCVLTGNTAWDGGGAIYNAARNIGAAGGPSATATLLITNCHLSNNTASLDDDKDPTGVGGAIYNDALGDYATAAITITHSTLTGNTADDDFRAGGAIYNFANNSSLWGEAKATLHIANSTLADNAAPYGDGGAIASSALDQNGTALVTIIDSTLSHNSSGSDFGGGGAILNFAYNRDAAGLASATLNLFNTTLNGNTATADRGGGVFNGALDSYATAVTNILNTTFSGNTAAVSGGAIANNAYNRDQVGTTEATVNATHTTLVGNNAAAGGAIDNIPVNDNMVIIAVNLKNSLIANSSGGDCLNSGTISGANNLIDDASCGSDTGFRLAAPTLFSPNLQNNGGPTPTHALLTGSNALDAVPPATAPSSTPTPLSPQTSAASPARPMPPVT